MTRRILRNHDRIGRHVRLMHFMMNTPAWLSLDATARAIYVHMAMRYAGPGSNNGRLPYSVREAAAELHIGKSTASRGLTALVNRGFIVAAKRGAFSLKKRHATEWRLTEFASDVDSSFATKDFTRWSPENQKSVPPAKPIGTQHETARYPERHRALQ
jgi:DNA-binding transcriptional regulator YhcF (GntR family)